MKLNWKNIGLIYDIAKHGLPDGSVGFAQSPQAVQMDGFVRIYFSSRKIDEKNPAKFLSHVYYADFSNDFSALIKLSEKPVLSPGSLGCYDEHGIFPLNALQHNGNLFGYISGWTRRKSVSVDTGIGISISNDGGETFKRLGPGPILSSSLNEPFLVGDPFVKYINGKFHMWYIFGTKWKKYSTQDEPDRTYKIGHATSVDGINWKNENGIQIIEDAISQDESQALPTVVEFKNRYHMIFCFRESSDFRKNKSRGYRLGYAWSDDLINWNREDEASVILNSGHDWDSDMRCYPNLFEIDGKLWLFYNGNEFGRHGFGAAMLLD